MQPIKIAGAELEIMLVLWRENRPLSFTEIRKALEETIHWKKSTIQTLVSRLKDKGVISAEENYVTLYSPNISQEEYAQTEGQSFINKLFDGSAKNLVSALCRNGQLNESDIDELKEFFKMGG